MGKYLTPSCRGFGYWSWKPWSIHHVLQDMQEGDRLLYLDAGCHININGAKRFREYVDMLDRDSRGMLVFTNGQPGITNGPRGTSCATSAFPGKTSMSRTPSKLREGTSF